MTATWISQLTHNISINKDYLGSGSPHMDAAQGKTQQELGCKGATEQSGKMRRMRCQGFQGVLRDVEGTLGSSPVMQMDRDPLSWDSGSQESRLHSVLLIKAFS